MLLQLQTWGSPRGINTRLLTQCLVESRLPLHRQNDSTAPHRFCSCWWFRATAPLTEDHIAVTPYPAGSSRAGQKAKNGHFALCGSRNFNCCRPGGVLFLLRCAAVSAGRGRPAIATSGALLDRSWHASIDAYWSAAKCGRASSRSFRKSRRGDPKAST